MKLTTIILTVGIIFFACITTSYAQQKVSDGTVSGNFIANPSAILELASHNKGLLHARVQLISTTNPAPLAGNMHVAGMMIYNTITINDVVPGIYYNDGNKWVLASAGELTNINYNPTTYMLSFKDINGNNVVIDFKQVVVANQKISTIADGINTTVTSTASGQNTNYQVNVATAHGANGANPATLGVVKEATINPTVTVSQSGELAVNLNNINSVTTKSTDYTATINDNVILVNAANNDVTIQLPNAIGQMGKKYVVKKSDIDEDNYVFVMGNIGGLPTPGLGLYTALPYSGWELVSDGAQWQIVNKF